MTLVETRKIVATEATIEDSGTCFLTKPTKIKLIKKRTHSEVTKY